MDPAMLALGPRSEAVSSITLALSSMALSETISLGLVSSRKNAP
jgi:hypothetical protein